MIRRLLLLAVALAALPLRAQPWEEVAPLPTPRAYAAVAVLNEQVYVIGGRGPGGAVLGTVERYDPVSNTWQQVESLREPRYNAAATLLGGVFNGRILLTGGYAAGDGVTDDVEVYIPGENDWESFDSMENEREGHGAFTVGGVPYVFGGSSPGGVLRDDAEYYDLGEEHWYEYEPWRLHTPRAAFASVPLGSGVFLFGGYSLFGPVAETEFYVPGQGGVLRAPMPVPRGGLAAAGDDERAWAIGGRDAAASVVARVDVYEAEANVWMSGPSLPAPREGAVAAVVDSTLYVFGGQDGQGTLYASSLSLDVRITTAAEPDGPAATGFALEPAGPNPFRAGTRLALRLDAPAAAAIVVYDALGRRVAVLHEGTLPAGRHIFGWDGTDTAGRRLPSGFYAVQAVAGEQRALLRLTLVR